MTRSSTSPILVTGASGFVASHVIDVLLECGQTVRGTVRSTSRGQTLLSRYPRHQGRLSYVVIDDIASSDLSKALEGVSAIMHVASPFTLDPKRNEDLLRPAIDGTTHLLESALAAGVKRVILTSSFAAVRDLSPGGTGHWRDYTYTERDWNPTTYDEAADDSARAEVAYAAGKALAERAAWRLVEENPGRLELTTLCPPVVYGPLLTAQENAPLNTSSQDLLNLISHPSSAPSTRLPIFIDVRDLAVAHIRALQRPGSIGKRIPLAGGTLWLDEAVDYLRTERPAVASRLPPASEGPLEKDTKTLARYDISLARDVLGIEAWMDWRQCLLDAVDSLLQREAASST